MSHLLCCAEFFMRHSLFVLAVLASPSLVIAQTPASTNKPVIAPAADTGVPTLVINATATQEDKPRRIGGGITPPTVISAPQPEFSQQARADGVGGTVLVYLQVDPQGNPIKVRVLKGVGHGLDEKAVEAVKQYKFKPALDNGTPVLVELNVQVNFQIFKKDPGDPASGGTGNAGLAANASKAPGPGPITESIMVPPPADPYSSTLGRPPATDAERAGLQTVADRKRFDDDVNFARAVLEARAKGTTADERLARWKRANKIANNECVACLHAIIAAQMVAAQWKDAIVSCKNLDTVGPDAKDRFYAENQMGIAYMHANSDNPRPEQAQLALAAFQAAVGTGAEVKVLEPALKLALYQEGRAYAILGQDAEATAAFHKYLELATLTDTYRSRAEHFISNPRLAAMPMAPPFVVTTSEGERLNLDDMNGKVVLLDFWATWCGPCKETLPEIQKIAKTFAGQPLVVLSISSDSDEMAWKNFVSSHNMDWPQYRDANGSLNRAYGVSSIPRFFTIDADGVLQSVKVGSNADIAGDLKKLIKKASEKTGGKGTERASTLPATSPSAEVAAR